MGSLFDGKCYTTASQAADAFFLSKEPSYTAGATSYLSYFEKPADTWLIVRKSIASNGTITNLTSSTAPVPTFPACDPLETFVDGQTVGWMIAGVLVLVWGLNLIRKLIA